MQKKNTGAVILFVILCLGCCFFGKEKIGSFLEKRNMEQEPYAPDEILESGMEAGDAGEDEEDYRGWSRNGVERDPISAIRDGQVIETGAAIQGGDDLHQGSKPLSYDLVNYFFVRRLEQLEEIEGYKEEPDILYFFDEDGNYNPEKFGNLLCLEYRVTNLEDHEETYAPHIGRLIVGWKNGRVGTYITGCDATRLEKDNPADDSVFFQAGETKTMHELVCIFVPVSYIDDMTAELLISPVCNTTWDVNSGTQFYHLPLSGEQKEIIWKNSKIYSN